MMQIWKADRANNIIAKRRLEESLIDLLGSPDPPVAYDPDVPERAAARQVVIQHA